MSSMRKQWAICCYAHLQPFSRSNRFFTVVLDVRSSSWSSAKPVIRILQVSLLPIIFENCFNSKYTVYTWSKASVASHMLCWLPTCFVFTCSTAWETVSAWCALWNRRAFGQNSGRISNSENTKTTLALRWEFPSVVLCVNTVVRKVVLLCCRPQSLVRSPLLRKLLWPIRNRLPQNSERKNDVYKNTFQIMLNS